MNSKVIKFVAGAGKTTLSIEYMKCNPNGLYLAFNNDVVNDIKYKGFLSKTIDGLFNSFIIPKLISTIPLIGTNKIVGYIDTNMLPDRLKNVSNIGIDEHGNIYNKRTRNKDVIITLSHNREVLKKNIISNSIALKYIFGENELRLTDSLRSELSLYLLKKYSSEIIFILKSRFSYIIFDEAQDLSGWREEFVKMIYNSDIYTIVLGDDNQNINGGGKWFEQLVADDVKNYSFRCPNNNCEWIREKLCIDIYGNDNSAILNVISLQDVLNFNDGNRVLLYHSYNSATKEIIDNWKGEKKTIKTSKGSTINQDIVIVGKTINYKFLYTAITRSTKNIYMTFKEKDIKFN